MKYRNLNFAYNLRVFILNLFVNRRFLLQTGAEVDKIAQFMQIYRSREVGQSYFTSVWTTLIATLHALWLMLKLRPQVVFFPCQSANYMTSLALENLFLFEPVLFCCRFSAMALVPASLYA